MTQPRTWGWVSRCLPWMLIFSTTSMESAFWQISWTGNFPVSDSISHFIGEVMFKGALGVLYFLLELWTVIMARIHMHIINAFISDIDISCVFHWSPKIIKNISWLAGLEIYMYTEHRYLWKWMFLTVGATNVKFQFDIIITYQLPSNHPMSPV